MEGQEFFLLKRKGGPTFFWEKNTKIPQPSPPQEKPYLALDQTTREIDATLRVNKSLKIEAKLGDRRN